MREFLIILSILFGIVGASAHDIGDKNHDRNEHCDKDHLHHCKKMVK